MRALLFIVCAAAQTFFPTTTAQSPWQSSTQFSSSLPLTSQASFSSFLPSQSLSSLPASQPSYSLPTSQSSFLPSSLSSQSPFWSQTLPAQIASATFSPASFAGQSSTSFAGQSSTSFAGQSSAPFAGQSSVSFAGQSTAPPADVRAAYQSLYDPNQFRSFNMVIDPTNLALMNRDPKQEVKVHCQVTTNYGTPQATTDTSSNLGCGYKGSVGSLRICFDPYGKFSPSDCRKPSYKIDADYFNPNADDRIDGVKRIQFHGAPADWSLVSERLAYYLLHQWGIIAPTATHSDLYLNGRNLGVFAFVSNIDDVFSQVFFGNDYNQGRGGLYKEVWFNPVHMATLPTTKRYGKNEDAFLNQIEAAVMSTPLTKDAATQFFNTYFDVDALVNVTAADTVLGDTDDWRQRHNMWWYIRDDARGKKAVIIPWDYDRLNDPGADTRGALKGQPWWDPNTATNCNAPLRSAAQRGALKGGSDPAQVSWWTDIFANTPADVEVPVSCDKITQLMALALGPQIRQRTREFAASLNRPTLQGLVQTWTNQISSALAQDPDKSSSADVQNEQRSLLDFIFTSAQNAVNSANNADRGVGVGVSSGSTFSSTPSFSSSSFSTSTGPVFVPKAQAGSLLGFAPATQTQSAFQSSFSQPATFTQFSPAQFSFPASSTSFPAAATTSFSSWGR